MFDSGANLFSELKSIFENGAASNGGSHPKTQILKHLAFKKWISILITDLPHNRTFPAKRI